MQESRPQRLLKGSVVSENQLLIINKYHFMDQLQTQLVKLVIKRIGY